MNYPICCLGQIANVKGGKRLPKGETYSNEKTKHPYLRVCDFNSGSIDETDLQFLRVETHRRIAQYTISSDDIYISIAGSIGIVGIIPKHLSGSNLTENAAKLVIKEPENVSKEYLSWYLKTNGQSLIQKKIKATSQPKLALFRIEEIAVPLPPIATQKHIAAILDQAEELRSKRRSAIALLDELGRSVFLEMFGDPAINPKGWESTRFQEILSIPLRNGLSPSTSGTVMGKVLTLSAITGSEFRDTAVKTSTFQSILPIHQTVADIDFLICRGNGNIHLVGKAYFPTKTMSDVAFPDTMIAAQIKQEYISRSFLQYIWNMSFVRSQIESLARTTNGTFKVNQTMLENITLPIPPLELQQQFAERMEAIETLKATHRQSLAKLDSLFNSLQSAAFNGELGIENEEF